MMLAQVAGYSLTSIAILVVIVAAIVALIVVGVRAMGLNVPPWFVQVCWIVLIAVVIIIAIKLVAGIA